MPGLAGFIPPDLRTDHAFLDQLSQMVKSMSHESFYSSGTCADDTLGIHAGWVCHAESYSDCMPVWNEARDVGIVFAGDHFADPTENRRLRAAGHQFPGDDASCLVHMYEEHGPRFFSKLNGTFCGLLWDRRENKAMLFNDRFGLGRVYYHEIADGFYFASEAKALLKVLPDLRSLDIRGLGELMVCGCTLQDRTLFPGVSLLPPGSVWTFSPGRPVCKENYFDPARWEEQSSLPPEDYYAALKETFTRILPRYFSGRQPIALSLTGGLDSRMILAGRTTESGWLPCHSFGGTYRDSEDVRLARTVAGLCQQSHSVIRLDDRFHPKFLDLAARSVYVTDGAMDVTGSVGLHVNRLAREFAPVRMTGNYGSEILRENVAFKAGRVATNSPFSEELTPSFADAVSTFEKEKRVSRVLSFIAFKQVPWHHYARLAQEQSQLIIQAPYLDNELVALAYRAPAGLLLNKQLAYRYTTEMRPALAGVPTDRGLLELPRLVPRRLFEFLKEVRSIIENRFDYGMPQWLAKVDHVIAPLHVERLFLGQQKYYHFRVWYKNKAPPVFLDTD